MKLLAPSTNWLIAAAVSFVVAGCASTGAKPQAAPATADHPEPGKGLVLFYRESHFKGGAEPSARRTGFSSYVQAEWRPASIRRFYSASRSPGTAVWRPIPLPCR